MNTSLNFIRKPRAAPSTTTLPATPSATPAAGTEAISKQLKTLLELAKNGQVPGIKYAAHTGMIDEVRHANFRCPFK
ncbi:hypothetical protein SAMN04487897_104170 [Paenibacillus sp. yr247]|nr:hypothetical protein SAMN04487897_104170 [Paenibacillus sp. yr247]